MLTLAIYEVCVYSNLFLESILFASETTEKIYVI